MTEHRPVLGSLNPRPYRFREADYLLLEKAGAFDRYIGTELVGGTIYAVNAQFSAHARVHSLLYQAVVAGCARAGRGMSAWIEVTVRASDNDLPQPDIIVAAELPDQGPVPVEQVRIVIEVADTSLAFDLDEKQRVYAAAGVGEYWVADVNGRTIHQMSDPSGSSYGEIAMRTFGQLIRSATMSDLIVETAGL